MRSIGKVLAAGHRPYHRAGTRAHARLTSHTNYALH